MRNTVVGILALVFLSGCLGSKRAEMEPKKLKKGEERPLSEMPYSPPPAEDVPVSEISTDGVPLGDSLSSEQSTEPMQMPEYQSDSQLSTDTTESEPMEQSGLSGDGVLSTELSTESSKELTVRWGETIWGISYWVSQQLGIPRPQAQAMIQELNPGNFPGPSGLETGVVLKMPPGVEPSLR